MAKKNLRGKIVGLECVTQRYDQVFFDTCAIDGRNNSIRNVYALYEFLSRGGNFSIISSVEEEFLDDKMRKFFSYGGRIDDWVIREDLIALLKEKGSICNDPDKICPYVEGRLTPVDAAVFSAGYYSALDSNKSAVITIDTKITDVWGNSMRDGFMLDRGIGIHDFSMFRRMQKNGYQKVFP